MKKLITCVVIYSQCLTIHLGVVLGLLLLGTAGFSSVTDPSPNTRLRTCAEESLGVKILCDPAWQVTKQFSSVTLQVSQLENDQATVTIAKSLESGLLFEDLTPSALQNVYDYADHFKYSRLNLRQGKAVCVTGHPAAQPDTQLIDYFILKDTDLYRISFSVSPQQKFKDYGKLFEDMILSFEFLDVSGQNKLP